MFSLQLAAMLMVVGLRVYCCFPSKIRTVNNKPEKSKLIQELAYYIVS